MDTQSDFPIRMVKRNSAFLRANVINWLPEPIQLEALDETAEPSNLGKLTLRKENGAVKGFEYQCSCGKKDYFVCE